MYPATRAIKKDFIPIPCSDGFVRPVILILLEELVESGIEEICLVLGSEEERKQYFDFFDKPLPDEHIAKLNPQCYEYEKRISEIGKRLRYVYQVEKRGFGHAVYQAADFAGGEPVLLMLGDTIYQSHNNKPCALQLIEKYEKYNTLMVGIHPIPLSDVSHYGILKGIWEDRECKVLNVSAMHEKPKASYAEEFLSVLSQDGFKGYYSVFGQYILTPEVFEQLANDIKLSDEKGIEGEIELTSALDKVRERKGMFGVCLDGKMFDMGNPIAFRNAVIEYSK